MFDAGHDDRLVQRGIDEAFTCRDMLARTPARSLVVARADGRLISLMPQSFTSGAARPAFRALIRLPVRQGASLLLTLLVILGLTLSGVLVGSPFSAETSRARVAAPEGTAAIDAKPIVARKGAKHGKERHQKQRQELDEDSKVLRPEGLAGPPPLRVRNGELVPTGDTRKTVSAQAGDPKWFYGKSSHTYRENPITGIIDSLTDHKVGYWGTDDRSYPKVGDLYYGSVLIGNVGTVNTAVAADIELPPNTSFAIDSNDANKQVRCFLWNFKTDENAEHMTEMTGTNCDQTPIPLLYGAHFAPTSSANPGYWWIAPGWAVFIVFPISSGTELNGMPRDCMIGSVFAAGALGDGWDHPEPTDTCPLGDGHGASQGVFVALGDATNIVPPPANDSSSTTFTKVKKCKKIKDKQKRKKCLNKIKK